MDSQQEQQGSHDMRELARQYADGRFNKEEYRNRRRDLLARCSGEPASAEAEPAKPPEKEPLDPESGQRILRIVAIVCVGLMVLMGAVIVSLGK